MDPMEISAWTYPDFCEHYGCNDVYDVAAMLSDMCIEAVGECAREYVESIGSWPAIRTKIGALDGPFIKNELNCLVGYLEEIEIAAKWEGSKDTFYGCVSKAIGDGQDFIKYLES